MVQFFAYAVSNLCGRRLRAYRVGEAKTNGKEPAVTGQAAMKWLARKADVHHHFFSTGPRARHLTTSLG